MHPIQYVISMKKIFNIVSYKYARIKIYNRRAHYNDQKNFKK
jgi:hypothetical protein